MTRPERLAEYDRRLGDQTRSRSAEEALARVRTTLDEVEDAFSNIPKSDPPPPLHQSDGRMYPPQDDQVIRIIDGRIRARTRGHIIRIDANGGIIIQDKTSGRVEFHQAGGKF